MSQTPSPSPSTFRPSGAFAIERAHDLREEILKHIQNADTLTIDLADCDRFDTIGVQLLLATQLSALKRQVNLTIENAPECFRSACHAAGVAPETLTSR